MSAKKKSSPVVTEKKNPVVRFFAGVKEFFRKKIVSLKRDTKIIPLVYMFVLFLYFSLNLTDVSDTTAKIQGAGMGLCQFTLMLFSMLSLVCLLNAFPRRKKANIPMLVVMFAMLGVMIFCDIHYCNGILAAVNRPENPIKVDTNTMYIQDAMNLLRTHTVLNVISAVLVATLPIYKKLLNMIKTSIDVEDNGAMGEIELSE